MIISIKYTFFLQKYTQSIQIVSTIRIYVRCDYKNIMRLRE